MTLVAGILGGIIAGFLALAGWVLVINRQLKRANGTKAWGQ